MRKSWLAVLTAALCLGQQCQPPLPPPDPPVEQGPAAQCVSDTIPANMTLGQTVTVAITFANTGQTTWTAASYELAAVDDSDPFSVGWHDLADGEEIAPGQQKTFSFQFTASRTGTYVSDWQMRRRGSEWFGDILTRSILVSETPTIAQHPASASGCPGETITLAVVAAGNGLSYQWQKDGATLLDAYPYSGATTPSLRISNISSAEAAEYRCVVSNPAGTALSNTAALTVRTATSVTQQPTAQTVCQLETATFTLVATGHGNFYYQWQKNGTDIPGATSSTLLIPDCSSADVAEYRCFIIGQCGTTMSDAATLTVNTPTAINQQPVAQNACSGTGATFSVDAVGTNLTYRWQKDGVDLTDGGNVSGATAATLQLSSTASADAGSYRCVVTGACGTGVSDAAVLTVKPIPAITQQPTPQAVCLGDNVSFNVAVSGEAPLTYQWRKNGVNVADGSGISGAQTATLQITGVTAAHLGAYTCVVNDGCVLSATSDPAALAFKPAPVIAGANPLAVSVEKNTTCADLPNQIALTATDSDTAPESLVWSIKTAPTHGTATFVGGITTGGSVTVCYTPNLDQINADSIVVQVTDGCSTPTELTIDITVQGCPNALVETFENYADQAAFETVWHDTNNSIYYFDATNGNPTGCVILPSPASNNLGRYYRNMGQKVNGTDAAPMTLTFDLWLDPAGAPGWGGARHFVEIRGYAGGAYASGAMEAMLAMGLNNSSSDTFSSTRYQGRVVNGSNWQTLDESFAPTRSAGWHQMKIEITTSQVKFYVDNLLSETENRPNTKAFDCVVIGSDLTASGWIVRVDNIRVTCGQ